MSSTPFPSTTTLASAPFFSSLLQIFYMDFEARIYNQFRLLTKLGDRPNAERDFTAAEQTALTSAGLNEVCWYFATRNVGLQFALKTCDAALVKNAKNATAMDSKGFVLLRMARYRDAVSSYDSALRLCPGLADSLFGRGIAKRWLGDLPDGDADLRAAAAAPATLKEYADSAWCLRTA
jgi:tetratricopeptide (TPR) repeat protein